MRKIAPAFLITSLMLLLANSAVAAPNVKDPYLPIIKDISVDFTVSALQAPEGYTTYPLLARIDLLVRVHANSLSGFSINLSAQTTNYPKNQCQFVSGDQYQGTRLRFNAGTTNGNIQTPTLPVLKNLITSKPDGDWRLEMYRFYLPVGNNRSLEPCLTDFKIGYLYLIDEALHEKSILLGYPAGPFYEMYTVPQPESIHKLLPESACPAAKVMEFANSLAACVESEAISALIPGFNRTEIDDAIFALKKAQGTPTATPSPTPTATASASPKPTATSKPSTTVKKMQTIRCQKAKTIKKVMGYNPTCPKGFTKL